ncbi:STAS domain-containing protein [Shewanella subflava]|uniref:Anti-sigma factor antagonist n=1 Tax=Shewanella subflava TaxID=2986476 RepID=A0ABT3I4P7_9GAMM|nr:STAS domain-containing protein [Shewanella subflava]MCW3171037.1 STAS domain-containing protein [Shewanella subflava]
MNFELITDKYASVVRLPGKMVMAQTPTYRAAILDYINQGHTRLVIDMSNLEYIDSSGLSVLISARKQAMSYQGNIVLLNPKSSVRALIELTRLHHIMDIYESEEHALESLSSVEEIAS